MLITDHLQYKMVLSKNKFIKNCELLQSHEVLEHEVINVYKKNVKLMGPMVLRLVAARHTNPHTLTLTHKNGQTGGQTHTDGWTDGRTDTRERTDTHTHTSNT